MSFRMAIKYDYIEHSSIFTTNMSLLSGLSLPIIKNCSVSQATVTHCSTVVVKYIYLLLNYPQTDCTFFQVRDTTVVVLHNTKK